MKRFLAYLGCVVVGGLLVAGALWWKERYTSPPPSVEVDTCLLDECLNGSVNYPIAELDEAERIILIEIGLEQLRLEQLVASMIERFGQSMQPFAATVRIEARQTQLLQSLFDKYAVSSVKIPETGLGSSQATTKRAGCVQVLDQVRHFQERLFNERNAFAIRPDIRRYMQEAAQMSRDTLLPAFERCAKEEPS